MKSDEIRIEERKRDLNTADNSNWSGKSRSTLEVFENTEMEWHQLFLRANTWRFEQIYQYEKWQDYKFDE